ncbi:MAG: AAA family ATPase [Chloroflexi bacterium]|nr:AAA family ATPase [Chloroflexota bacterium]
MLEEIRLKNFKAFGDDGQVVRLGRVTIFIGENGTGKSSVLQALQLLSQSAGRQSLVASSMFQFSDYQDIIHKKDVESKIVIGYRARVSGESKGQHSARIEYSACFASEDREVRLREQSGVIEFDNWPPVGEHGKFEGTYHYGDMSVNPSKLEGANWDVTLQSSDRVCEPIVAGGGSYRSPSAETAYRAAYLAARDLLTICKSVLTKYLFIVRSGRGFDQLAFSLGEETTEHPETPDELATTFAYRRELEGTVAGWIANVTGVNISVHVIPKRFVELRSTDGYNIYHEGFGTGQLVKPMVQIAMAPRDSLIAVEEPEIHLHPVAQIRLSDMLADIAVRQDKQILLTTHSDHILAGFLNIVAEGKLKAKDLSVCYFEKQEGQVRVVQSPVADNGMIEGGLRGFAEVELTKLERHLKALTKPK